MCRRVRRMLPWQGGMNMTCQYGLCQRIDYSGCEEGSPLFRKFAQCVVGTWYGLRTAKQPVKLICHRQDLRPRRNLIGREA